MYFYFIGLIFMQSFTTDKDFSCSIKLLHGSLKIVQQNYTWCLPFDAVCSYLYVYALIICIRLLGRNREIHLCLISKGMDRVIREPCL